jgi:hypothetical protein
VAQNLAVRFSMIDSDHKHDGREEHSEPLGAARDKQPSPPVNRILSNVFTNDKKQNRWFKFGCSHPIRDILRDADTQR